ncbi:MAG: FAD-dependent oxidoreductase [Clostridia bacterium]|jgi:electron transfer flavoprotein-quinone oxidoreductase|nr:FAD-dependent oxidoreductase [Clostridia bacterium]
MLKGDVVIVGAGPAGTAAAYVLAREGAQVYLLERGRQPGNKNLFGGAFYCQEFAELIPDFLDEAPIERIITKRTLTVLGERNWVDYELNSTNFANQPYNAVTVLRPKFDAWFAKKACQQGACLLNNTVAVDLLWENGKVVGVETDRPDGKIYADVVIGADGATSLMARQGGLANPKAHQYMALGIKQVFYLQEEEINKRFRLTPGEGLAREFLGGLPVIGGGFLYTNKSSLSVGVVIQLESLQDKMVQVVEVMEDFCRNPAIKELVAGSIPVEYGAHLIPEGGYHLLPKLYTDGMLLVGDAAGLVLATGFTFEGMNYAITSGIMAAKAILKASRNKDYSASSLKEYKSLLEESYVLPNFRKCRHIPELLANHRVHFAYPEILTKLAENNFKSDAKVRQALLGQINRELTGKVGKKVVLVDLYKAWRFL